ncbi:hypothetical protein MBRA1_002703 [Malassezia brasiliensis]|uniref:RRN7-type domain-containing protein n=1 Tax=Malassezia brasiliensis TaxID=1821822 RepID=A0AAF0IPE8_9BASI|nr:hypothetical protein MBRA1_002703 [Malassezia brasiliensis]
MQARRRCAVCGSARFRLVAAQLVCAAGHVQRDFRVEAAHDEDGFGTQITTRARAVNRASQREAAHAERRRRQYLARKVARGRTPLVVPGSQEHAALDDQDAAYLYGARATFAVLEALQLVLRHQIAAVERLYGIEGLAAAARPVWALHVSSAGVPPTPLDAACDAAERPTRPPPASVPRTGRQRWSDAAHHAASLDLVSLRSTVATVYLALVRRRCPISIGQLRTHIQQGTLPYLHAIHVLPAPLLDVLSYSDVAYAGLDTELVPSVMDIHRRVADIATRLSLDFGVVWPEVNAPPMLARMVHAMLLPAPVYVAAKALLAHLRIDMHVRNVSAQLPRQAREGRTRSIHSYARNAAIPRCVMLMAAVIVVLKLRHGLDGVPRADPLDALPPLGPWLAAVCAATDGATDGAFRPWDPDADLLGLSDAQVDMYLDFVEQTYTRPYIPPAMRAARRDGIADLLSCAPAADAQRVDVAALARADEARAEAHRAALYAAPAPAPRAPRAAGEAYPVYAHDPSGTWPREYTRVLACAQRVLGLDAAPAASFVAHDVRHLRDADVLHVAVLQLDEALVTTLHRRRAARK